MGKTKLVNIVTVSVGLNGSFAADFAERTLRLRKRRLSLVEFFPGRVLLADQVRYAPFNCL